MPSKSSKSNLMIDVNKNFRMTERVGLKEESQILLPAIANRMNKIPYAEQCKK